MGEQGFIGLSCSAQPTQEPSRVKVIFVVAFKLLSPKLCQWSAAAPGIMSNSNIHIHLYCQQRQEAELKLQEIGFRPGDTYRLFWMSNALPSQGHSSSTKLMRTNAERILAWQASHFPCSYIPSPLFSLSLSLFTLRQVPSLKQWYKMWSCLAAKQALEYHPNLRRGNVA